MFHRLALFVVLGLAVVAVAEDVKVKAPQSHASIKAMVMSMPDSVLPPAGTKTLTGTQIDVVRDWLDALEGDSVKGSGVISSVESIKDAAGKRTAFTVHVNGLPSFKHGTMSFDVAVVFVKVSDPNGTIAKLPKGKKVAFDGRVLSVEMRPDRDESGRSITNASLSIMVDGGVN